MSHTETVHNIIMRNALVEIARAKHPATTTRTIRQQNIAREALVAIGWDFWRNQPIQALGEQIERMAGKR